VGRALHVVNPRVTLTDSPDDAAQEAIESGLARYNAEQAGLADARPLAVLISDPATGRTVGGLRGRTSLGLLFVDRVFIPAHLRGDGLGRRLLTRAEDEGRRRGCVASVLYTISFQAPEFYERHEYRRFGTIDCQPPGTRRIFMTKQL
jgi:GNAT superfamily N-acetyltransferase